MSFAFTECLLGVLTSRAKQEKSEVSGKARIGEYEFSQRGAAAGGLEGDGAGSISAS